MLQLETFDAFYALECGLEIILHLPGHLYAEVFVKVVERRTMSTKHGDTERRIIRLFERGNPLQEVICHNNVELDWRAL